MKIKLHPRFFFLLGFLGLGLIIFSSNVFLKKRVEVRVVDSVESGNVLAASDGSQGSYDLKELSSTQSTESNTQETDISSYQPVTISHTIKEGDTLQSIAEKYHADPQTIADFPNNGLQESLELTVGDIVIVPNGYIDESQRPILPAIAQGTGQFAWPIRLASLPQGKPVITQYAYYWHAGSLDIALDLGTPVRAADDGTVKSVERLTTGYGVHVVIEHGDGLTSLYGHLTDAQVVLGQGIHKGDVLGTSGSTGRSTGPHLHFEVRRNGAPVDPMTLLPPQ